MKKYIPNFITSLNLSAGFIAIILTANQQIFEASLLILAAIIFDFLDGLSARLLKAYSDIGKELDSLADVVSFGVAPALIIYQMINYSMLTHIIENRVSELLLSFILFAVPAFMPVCAALRLAKFNVDPGQATIFKGLPTPASALAVISVVIGSHYTMGAILRYITGNPSILILFSIILSLLMVIRLPMLSLKFSNFKIRGNEGRYLLILFVIISFAIMGITALPLIIPLYIIASLITLFF